MKNKIEYTIVSVNKTKRDMSEKTFCFACGCFQGGVPSKPGTTGP